MKNNKYDESENNIGINENLNEPKNEEEKKESGF
jgi:hypothetical protein